MKSNLNHARKILFFVLIALLAAGFVAFPGLAQTPVYTLAITAGDSQSTPAGTHFLNPLQVTVSDGANPVPDVAVTFSAPTSGATAYLTAPGSPYATTLVVTTDASGVASANATASCTPGAYQVTAAIGDQSVTFSLTNSGAASQYCRDSYWMADPLNPGQPAPDTSTPIDSTVEGYWWRDTSHQNALLQHSLDLGQFKFDVLYTSDSLNIYEYIPDRSVNVTLFTSGSNYFIIGCGGGISEATNAKSKLAPFIYGKTLRGIVMTDALQETIWGCKTWLKGTYGVPLYASSQFDSSLARQFLISQERTERIQEFWGTSLPWSSDGFLGSGIMKEYRASFPQFWEDPTVLISQSTDITFNGNTIRIIPTGASSDGLMVYLPTPGFLKMAEFMGSHLPDTGFLPNDGYTIAGLINSVIAARTLAPNMLALKAGPPITGSSNVAAYLLDQRDALIYIQDRTKDKINQHYTLDEIVASLKLPDTLANKPYLQEFASDIPSIVRMVWNEWLGSWDGNTTSLAATLTEDIKAQVLADAMGGVDNLVAAAKQAELAARDLPGAEKALYLADAAYRVAPDNFEAKQVYAQTLRKNAFMQTSAYKRNYYISVANSLGTEQMVSDISKTGQEDTAVTFTAAEFSQAFNGIGGALLAMAHIDSLPPAENGVLTLPGTDESGNPILVPITAGQEIPVANLDGLLFTPAPDWNGFTSFLWNGKDGSGYAVNPASVRITLDPANDPPVVSSTPLADVTVDEDAAPGAIDLSAGFTDVDIATDGDVLTYAATSSSDSVSLSVDGSSLTLTLQSNWNGTANFSVTATDAEGLAVSDDFTVTANPVNDAPTAADATITVVAGKSQTISLDYGDLETAQADLTVTGTPAHGTLSGTAPNLTYTAPSDFSGDDSFTYTVTDRGDPDNCATSPCSAPVSTSATVHVTVLPAPSGSISGVAFNDADGNGTLDAGESGLAGVTIDLKDAGGIVLESATTAADGSYVFTALNSGVYRVSQALLPGSVATTPLDVDLTLAEGGAQTVNFGQVVSADLKVTMTYSVNRKTIIYAITITNDGPAAALSGILTDVLPDTVAYVSVISTQGSCGGGRTVNCNFGTIASGASVTVTIQVNRVNTRVAIVNTASVSSSIFDIDLADNSATMTTP